MFVILELFGEERLNLVVCVVFKRDSEKLKGDVLFGLFIVKFEKIFRTYIIFFVIDYN